MNKFASKPPQVAGYTYTPAHCDTMKHASKHPHTRARHLFGQSILREVIALQSTRMPAVPVKLEATMVKDYACADLRQTLAKKTHEISIFTEGVLAMEATLLGVIQVDPRAILTDGIRKHLVESISVALHTACARA